MTEIHGEMDDRFARVREAFVANFAADRELGASVAVVHRGALVVDLWAGWADPDRTRPWERDTITNVWSTTKTVTALCVLMLVDRGEVDLDAPLADYWPEFAANGKDGVLVRHAMSHTAGLPGWAEPVDEHIYADWDLATKLLAEQAPAWEPGTAIGYHAVTQGYLLGELVRRVDGRTIGRFLADEVAGPVGADFHIGLDPGHDHRVSNVVPPLPLEIDAPGDIPRMALANPPMDARWSWTEEWRRAEIPAAGGFGNARSVAVIQSAITNGGTVAGTRLLSPETIERIFDEQADGTDLVLGIPNRHGIGFGLVSDTVPLSPHPRTCFWGGWGGSLLVNDVDSDLTVAYVMNRMGEGTVGDERGVGIVLAAIESVG